MTKIAFKYGAMLFIGETAFFLFMRLLGVEMDTPYRVFNILLQLVIMYFAIREYRLTGRSRIGHHLTGVQLGMYYIFVGAFAFGVFLHIFLLIDQHYMDVLKELKHLDRWMTPFMYSSLVFGEAIVVGSIGSYILTRIIDMNLAHNNTNVNSPE